MIEGMPSRQTGTAGLWAARGRGSKTSLQTYRDSQGRSHSPLPSASPSGGYRDLSPSFGPTSPSLSITRQAESFLSLADLPKYEAEGKRDEPPTPTMEKDRDDWISGTIEAKRNIMVVHLPQQEVSDLDERQNGYAHGIGMWNLRIASDVVSTSHPEETGQADQAVLYRRPNTFAHHSARSDTKRDHLLRPTTDQAKPQGQIIARRPNCRACHF